MSETHSTRIVVSKKHKIILNSFRNKVTYDLMTQASEEIWKHPDYERLFNGFIDFRGCDISMNMIEVLKLVQFFVTNANSSKGFIVVLADKTDSVAKSFIFKSKLSKRMNLHVVGELSIAMRTLGISADILDLLESPNAIFIEHKGFTA